ncbi:MAG: hypothetical protein AB7O65_00465 [Candidatus Korobacteraceae bacterium]
MSAAVALLGLLLALFLAGCHRGNIHQTLRKSIANPPSPTVLAVYEPWFGDRDHIQVGYSSQDPVVLRQQVQKARDIGISAFVVDWYGQRKAFLDGAYAKLQEVAAESDFKVILMYDEPEGLPRQATEYALTSLQYAYENYVGPAAPHRKAYFTYEGRPVLFVWPRHTDTDWARIRKYLQTWESPPLLIIQDAYPRHSDVFDGYFAWVQPGEKGWKPDGSNRGLEYLEGFYQRMQRDHSAKIAVGAAWPGFDDKLASWGQGRYMDARCGQTFDDTLRLFRRYYDKSNPLQFLLVVTWNDYEEGTAIEPGISRCREQQSPAQRSARND